MRMLMNNLDPDVAERPDDLVVYGGTGKAARDWPSFHAIVRTLDRRCATTRRCWCSPAARSACSAPTSGRRGCCWPTPTWSATGPPGRSSAGWRQLGLTMYGQMTAGSWIYIGTQGILQGTYETFAAVAAKRFGGTLAGTLTLTAGCGGMGGAQPLAVTMNGGVCLIVDVDRSRLRPPGARPLPRHGRRLPGRGRRAGARRQARPAGAVRRRGRQRRRRSSPSCCAAASRSTSSPTRPAPTTRCRTCRSGVDPADARRLRRRQAGGVHRPGPRVDGHATSRRWSASWTPAPRSSTTATRSAARRSSAATTGRSRSPASCPRTSGRCSAEGKGPFRWAALSGDPADIAATDRAVLDLFPENESLARWIRLAGERVAFQGLPARICWLGYGERDKAGVRFNDMVASGELSAPLVIGRDHLDCGLGRLARTGRPRRWPTAPTRSPTGRCSTRWSTPPAAPPGCRSTTAAASASAGRSTPGRCASPTAPPLAGQKIERVLTNDPGMGVDPARRRGLRARGRRRQRAGRARPDGGGARDRRPSRRALGRDRADRPGRRRRRLPAVRLDAGRSWRCATGSGPRPAPRDCRSPTTATATCSPGGATRAPATRC